MNCEGIEKSSIVSGRFEFSRVLVTGIQLYFSRGFSHGDADWMFFCKCFQLFNCRVLPFRGKFKEELIAFKIFRNLYWESWHNEDT